VKINNNPQKAQPWRKTRLLNV